MYDTSYTINKYIYICLYVWMYMYMYRDFTDFLGLLWTMPLRRKLWFLKVTFLRWLVTLMSCRNTGRECSRTSRTMLWKIRMSTYVQALAAHSMEPCPKVRSFFNFISPKKHDPSKTRKPNLLYLIVPYSIPKRRWSGLLGGFVDVPSLDIG